MWRNFISFSLRQLIRGESIVILDINRHNETLESIWIECKCKNGRQQQQNFTLYSSYVFVVIQWICVTYSFSLSRTKHSVRALASILLLFLVLCFFMLAVVRSAQFFFCRGRFHYLTDIFIVSRLRKKTQPEPTQRMKRRWLYSFVLQREYATANYKVQVRRYEKKDSTLRAVKSHGIGISAD